MMYFSGGRLPHGLLVLLLISAYAGWAQSRPSGALLVRGVNKTSCRPGSEQPLPAFPSVQFYCGHRLDYVGVYDADGLFHRLSQVTAWNGPSIHESGRPGQASLRPVEVPAWVSLHPVERVVDDFLPTYHARKKLHGESRLLAFLDRLVTFAYGRERALLQPLHVTTDSRGRVIVADPGTGAVHVLDGANSFRIMAGPHHRLATPNGVAADADDNIYVSDPGNGLVMVYDAQGRFLRYIGMLDGGEALFQWPTGIAIDRSNRRLYVLDTTRDRLFVMDLYGRIINRIGIGGDGSSATFHRPREIDVANGFITVLDTSGSRIQILDSDGRLIHRFDVAPDYHRRIPDERGLSLDTEGNIYVSDVVSSSVQVYSTTGQLIASFGQLGQGNGQFSSPGGLWIDAADRVYVADTGNHRVQVFQLAVAEESADSREYSGSGFTGSK